MDRIDYYMPGFLRTRIVRELMDGREVLMATSDGGLVGLHPGMAPGRVADAMARTDIVSVAFCDRISGLWLVTACWGRIRTTRAGRTTDDVVALVATGNSLFDPEDDRFLLSDEEMLDIIDALLGAR